MCICVHICTFRATLFLWREWSTAANPAPGGRDGGRSAAHPPPSGYRPSHHIEDPLDELDWTVPMKSVYARYLHVAARRHGCHDGSAAVLAAGLYPPLNSNPVARGAERLTPMPPPSLGMTTPEVSAAESGQGERSEAGESQYGGFGHGDDADRDRMRPRIRKVVLEETGIRKAVRV